MKASTKEWLKAAKEDLLVIELIINNENLTNIVAFHAQQCVEKSLKSLFEEKEIEFLKVHKLKKLFKKLSDLEVYFDSNNVIVSMLDDLYIESRYPSNFGLLPNGKPTLEDAKEFYDFAKSVYNQVCMKLEKI